jgi:transposase
MRKIKDVLRLHYEAGLKQRAIARSVGTSHTTVGEFLRRAAHAGLSWPLPEDLDETRLEQLLFPPVPVIPADLRPMPDWATIHQELKRKGVTLGLLWEEYQSSHPEGYRYSRFCDLYREWSGKLRLSMRQVHKAGEKLFVDYAGQTLPIVDRRTGEIREGQLFVAALGASSQTFAEATWTQGLPDWIGSHVRAFSFYGGVPEIVVPDNLRSAVSRPCRYEPDINPTYAELAAHYGCAVIPARVRKPKDKAKVEAAVLVVERFILARLRNRTFFSLTEANAAIRELVEQLNRRPFKKLPGCRQQLFDTLERPALKPLPATPYQFAEWRHARVNIDYHAEVDHHYYSVPYVLVKQQLDVRLTATTVEFLHKGQRVASHVRSSERGRHTTLGEHMPKGHREYAEWTPQRLVSWAAKTGPHTAALAEKILASRAHPQQGYRSVLGLIRLAKTYTPERLEAACQRALATSACRLKSVASILKTGLDRQPLPKSTESQLSLLPSHDNIRGASYYH